jgi:transcription elongation factor Elf1
MTIQFTTRCPNCNSLKTNRFTGLGQSHAEWIMNESKKIKWNCKDCGFAGDMPVFDVEASDT